MITEFGLIGEKLGHSFSKQIHGMLASYKYDLQEIKRDELGAFMRKKAFRGINVTIPYKQDVMPYLDHIDDAAKQIGAVNTVVNKNGVLYGYNTDFYGMKSLIERKGVMLRGKKVLVLGSGGTSKTARCVADNLGAAEVYRVSRGGGDGCITYTDAYEKHSDAQVIINTTPCGMYPNIGESAVSLDRFPSLCGVIDAVYNPLKSALVVGAKNRNIAADGGLYMLVAQAAEACRLFTGGDVSTEKTEEVYNAIYKSKQNVVLIGMPGCGKSTIGRIIAKQTGRDFYDTDRMIADFDARPIPRIISDDGEAAFRKIEKAAVFEAAKKSGCVIATGGGVILDSENVDLLRENGVLVFIDRAPEHLVTSSDRPLSSDREKLQKLYDARYKKYVDNADITVKAVYDINANVNNIIKETSK